MSHRMNPYKLAPKGYAALNAVEDYLKTCGLDEGLMHLVKMRVSQINGCAYCLHLHSADARKTGVSEVKLYLLNAWHESALYTKRERAALLWAESLTDISHTHAPDAVYDEARQEFTEKEFADLSYVIAMINAWNRIAIGFRSHHPADVATT